jgi:DNA recombination protein RmuC
MELPYLAVFTSLLVAVALVAVIWLGIRLGSVLRQQEQLPANLRGVLDGMHLEMIKDLNTGLNTQADRLAQSHSDAGERLRGAVSQDLKQTRDAMLVLQLSQTEELSTSRETMSQRLSALVAELQSKHDELRHELRSKHDELRHELLTQVLERLGEQSRAAQEQLQNTLHSVSQQLAATIDTLTRTTDTRLEQISGKVSERLEEGFKKTNETFANVMARLATIDEAQRKIDGLTTNVVSLQELLGDKRSRGAYGEIQLEALVRNMLPPSAYEFQYTLAGGARVDCVLKLPEPTGTVSVDAKFPLENYHRMFDPVLPDAERSQAARLFRIDLRRHVDAICEKYIVPGETSDSAVMFVPAEAVFAEIHAHHAEVVDYAMQRRVWIVSPTTMMAVLNTARAVLKDVETRRQVHIIKDELSKLGKDFGRFDQRLRKLADHIRMAHQDTEDLKITGDKLTRRFVQIEKVDLDELRGLAELDESGGKDQGAGIRDELVAPVLPDSDT